MTQKAESTIRTNIAQFIRTSDGFAFVTSGSIKTAQGIPDILGSIWAKNLNDYVHVAVEVKTENGEPSAVQVEVLKVMRLKGYLPMIVTGVREFDEIVRNYGYFANAVGKGGELWNRMLKAHPEQREIWS